MPTPAVNPVEFAVKGGRDSGDVFGALFSRDDIRWGPPTGSEATYLDTYDGRLHAAGLTLTAERHPARMRLASLRDGTPIATDNLARPRRGRIFVHDLAAGPLRDRIEGIVEVRVLLPLAHISSRRRSARVLDGEAKTVVRLAYEEPSLQRPGLPPSPLSPRLHASPVLGYDRAFQRIISELQAVPGLRHASRPRVDEAVEAAGGVPGGVSSKIGVHLRSDMRADEATLALLGRLADMVDANLPGTVADIDSEFLHDLRVAIRRSRSVLREMKGVLPAAGAARARVDLRWIQEITGTTRDLDVHLLGWLDTLRSLPAAAATDIEPLHDVLQRRRTQSFAAMRRQLRGSRYAATWQAWRGLLQEPLGATADLERPNAHRLVADVAGARISAVYRGMVKMGAAIDDESPPQSLHDLRKRGKELRYLLELYGQLWPDDVVAPMVSTLKGLQDVLGRFQDDEVQANYLRSLAPELGEATGGIDAVIALGLVIAGLADDEREARDAFAQRFGPFASASYRTLIRTTFAARS